jgi:predicted dehydrogenase
VHVIKAAVIGLGRWGKSLVEAVQGRSSLLRFVHGVSKEPESVADFAAKHRFRLSTELETALADPEVAVVFLATPHSLHVPQALAVAQAGKHLWCEKPLALRRNEAERIIEACSHANVVLATGLNKRWFSSMRALERIVRSGEIGELLHLEGHYCNEHSTRVVGGGWRDDPGESPGLGMTGAGLHVLDAFVNLAGCVESVDVRVFARKPPPDPRDTIAVLLQFASGATGTMGTVRAGPMYWRVQAFGTNGWVEAQGEDRVCVAPMGQRPELREFPHVDPLFGAVEAFASAIATGTAFPIAPVQMLDTIGAFEAVIKAANTGRRVTL